MIEKFSLPESSFNVVKQIIRAAFKCAPQQGSITLDEIAQTAALHRTLVSSNNKFLKSIGVLQGTKTFEMTDIGRELGLAIDHSDTNLSEQTLRKIVKSNEFLLRMLDAIRIRGSMETESFTSHIAISAGVPKEPRFLTGARTIIDLLLEANLLEKEDDTLKAKEEVSKDIRFTPETLEKEESELPPAKETPGMTKPIVNINININLSFEELRENVDLLRQKIRSILGEEN
ncbi:MAG: hypothetical protein MUO78_05445 [candidate division Zixibacteria bacterium]|nr:hypothetical protein [candidate division Zixibacteria bacterium]